MYCYYCEEIPTGNWYRLDSGTVVCNECLCRIGLSDLLTLLKSSTLGELLTRYGLAIRYTKEDIDPKRKTLSQRRELV